MPPSSKLEMAMNLTGMSQASIGSALFLLQDLALLHV